MLNQLPCSEVNLFFWLPSDPVNPTPTVCSSLPIPPRKCEDELSTTVKCDDDDAPQRDHHSPVQEPRDPPTRPRQWREGRGEPPSSDKGLSTTLTPRSQSGKRRWSVGAVSAWRAHDPVSLLHSGFECDDLWSLQKGLKHAEIGCGSANPPPPPAHTHTHTTPRTHTHAHSHSPLNLRGPAAEATHTSLHQ